MQYGSIVGINTLTAAHRAATCITIHHMVNGAACGSPRPNTTAALGLVKKLYWNYEAVVTYYQQQRQHQTYFYNRSFRTKDQCEQGKNSFSLVTSNDLGKGFLPGYNQCLH